MENISNNLEINTKRKSKLAWILLVFIVTLGTGYTGYKLFSTEKKIISFVRDGDIWVSDFDGKNVKRVTAHPDTKFRILVSARCVEKAGPSLEEKCRDEDTKPSFRELDFNNTYYSLPHLNTDKKFLAYSCLSEETLKIIQERQKLSQSLPDPDPLVDFAAKYSLCITKLSLLFPWINDEQLDTASISNVLELEWSPIGNTIAVLSENRIHIFRKNKNRFVLDKSFDYKNGGLQRFLRWSPNGKYLLTASWSPVASQQTSRNAGVRVIQKLLVLDLATGQYVDVLESRPGGLPLFGDWLDDSNIIFPHENQPGYNVAVSRRNIHDLTTEKIFEDNNFNIFGFISLSPNKRYMIYPHGTISSGITDIYVRDMNNGNSYSLFSLLPKDLIGRRTFTNQFVWLSDDTLLFSFTPPDVYPDVIWKLNPMSKQLTKFLENASIKRGSPKKKDSEEQGIGFIREHILKRADLK